MREGHSHGILWAEKYSPELTRLRELVKAQKEYIEFMSVQYSETYYIAYLHSYYISNEEIQKGENLRNKIKELEK